MDRVAIIAWRRTKDTQAMAQVAMAWIGMDWHGLARIGTDKKVAGHSARRGLWDFSRPMACGGV
jgi:hypothetical protein